MAEPTIQLGGGNWAGKSDNLLGYYKEGERFYKQDFTFSRSTTGTYTDKDGYIQEMPYNLLNYSEDFDNAAWTTLASGETIVSNSVISPDGTLNADTLEGDGSSTNVYVRQDITLNTSTNYTFSIFAKKGTNDFLAISAEGYSGATNTIVIFDINNGSVTTGTANIEDYGNGWFRCSYTIPISTDGVGRFLIYPAYNGTTRGFPTSSDANGQNIYLYGAQLNKGTSAKTYFPTTTRLNMPRVDYLNNSNGSLILEPQRSNLVTYSSDFSDSSWFKLGLGTASTAIVTTDYATSPEGLNNATRLQVDLNGGTTSSDQSLIYDALTVSSGDNTRSIYVKSNDGNTYDVYFGGTLSSYEIKEVTSEWTRIDATRNFASAGTGYLSIGLRGGTGCSDNADILIYGAQVESGSYPTTLINTQGSSVTRNADACNITDVADRIGQTEGTLFCEIDLNNIVSGYSQYVIVISDGSAANRVQFLNNSGNDWQLFITANTISNNINLTTSTSGVGRYKIAIAYKSGDVVYYINGVQKGTSNETFTFSTLTDFDLGQRYDDLFPLLNPINQAQLYNTRLSNSELATLTTL